jgi:hypothetical protein
MKTRMTIDEWQAEATKRFGDEPGNWKFVCPICKNVAAVDDFKPFKDRGATPDSARCECIGRYTLPKGKAIADEGKPCDYAGYGLFRLSPVVVVDGERESHSFAFAEA